MLGRISSALIGCLLTTAAAFSQSAQIQQTNTRLDAATSVCAPNPAAGASQAAGTCTITPPNGQYVYITTIAFAQCATATAQVLAQQNWTTTNLGGLAAQTSTVVTATLATGSLCDRVTFAPATPYKSAAPGTAVTLVPPGTNANTSFPMVVTYYFAP